MKTRILVCLGLLATAAPVRQAEAGRVARRAARTTAIVAAATSTTAVVAAAPRRTAVVVAAPVVVAAAAPVRSVAIVAAPDLTVTNIGAERDMLCIVVKNIGTAPSPATRLQLDLARSVDLAFLAGQTLRVPPLAVNQSVRIRLRSAPAIGVRALAIADPKNEVAELNERNNDLAAEFAAPTPAAEPPTLEAEEVWSGATGG
jgi:hypothetical protein